MHGEARESKEEQEGSKERAVSLPGNSLVLLLTHRRVECSFHSGFHEVQSPPPTTTMLNTKFLLCSDGFPFYVSILWLLQINQHQTGDSKQQKYILSQ